MLRTCEYVTLLSNENSEDVIQVNNLQVEKGPGLSTRSQANHESLKAGDLSWLWPKGDVTMEEGGGEDSDSARTGNEGREP